jgi:DNA modification methylase
MPRLTEQEQQEIVRFIEADKPLPDKYRFLLFEDKREVELVWNGKTGEVCNIVLPFQTIEQVDEPRKEQGEEDDLGLFDERGRQLGGWTNKLIWGDNKLILSSLKNGPMREEIERQGGLKLIYIDPPFDVGADFSMDIEIGDNTFTKKPNILEEIAYRDTWGRGSDSFAAMIYERLILMRDLLADDGSIFVHCDWRVTALIRSVLDEVFGPEHIRNEIIWTFTGPGSPGMKQFNRKHNAIYWFSKSKERWIFADKAIRVPHDDKTSANFKSGLEGSGFRADTYALPDGKIPESWWDMAIAQRFPVDGVKRVGYPTEKPWALIHRVLSACSERDDLVADFFCGGGVVPAAAESLGRRWIAADLGKFAIHTTRKRMIGVQRELKAEGKDYRAFEILNLGKYERQHFVGVNPNLREEEQRKQIEQKEADFLTLILRAYRAEPTTGYGTFHGKRAGRLVAVGPVNLPVTRLFVEEVILECRKKHITKVDILGFEFEMGLFPNVLDDARSKGIDISPKYIPAEVFDKRAVEKNQVVFHDVAYIEVKPIVNEGKKGEAPTVAVQLTDFSVSYAQDSIKAAEETLKRKGSKVVVEKGQIVKVSKSAAGVVTREVLTKRWNDWIDYWSVDFDFESKREIIRVQKDLDPDTQAKLPTMEPEQAFLATWEEQWTGDYVFENEWQSFRTRKDRSLELVSVAQPCEPGTRKVAVKVVDIFGNDTMTIVEVNIPGAKKGRK